MKKATKYRMFDPFTHLSAAIATTRLGEVPSRKRPLRLLSLTTQTFHLFLTPTDGYTTPPTDRPLVYPSWSHCISRTLALVSLVGSRSCKGNYNLTRSTILKSTVLSRTSSTHLFYAFQLSCVQRSTNMFSPAKLSILYLNFWVNGMRNTSAMHLPSCRRVAKSITKLLRLSSRAASSNMYPGS